MAVKVWTWNPYTGGVLNGYDDGSFEFALSAGSNGNNPVVKFASGTLLSATVLNIAPTGIVGGGNINFGVNTQTVIGAVGDSLRINAGGATVGSTDKSGGTLELVAGASTGAGRSALLLGAPIPGLTGTTTNNGVDQVYIDSIPVVNAGTNIATFALPALAGANITIFYRYYATDGTDVHVMNGQVAITAANKAGAITKSVTDSQTGPTGGTFSKSVTGGTVTSAVTLSGTTTQTITFTPTDSLSPTVQRLDYIIFSNVELTLL